MISNREAQELHLLVGGPIETALPKATAVIVQIADLERARELAAIIVSDTEATLPKAGEPIYLYLTGDEDGPDIFGVVYDGEDEALEAGRENEVRVWRVPFIPQLDLAIDVTSEEDDDA